jgi:hypothetical protein
MFIKWSTLRTRFLLLLLLMLSITGGIGGCANVNQDLDKDGLRDADEWVWIQQYSPYYMFDQKEDNGHDDYRPTDPFWYLERSALTMSNDGDEIVHLGSMNYLLLLMVDNGTSDMMAHPDRTAYAIKASESARVGNSWDECEKEKNIGLFAHVAPYKFDFDFAIIHIHINAVSIEYWQFFGFNDVDNFDTGDHEGDWDLVRVIIDPTVNDIESRIVSVVHYHHGSSVAFYMQDTQNTSIDEVTGFKKYMGSNYIEGEYNGDNSELRIYKDVTEPNKFTHPVVYIEEGTHEFWPTEEGSWALAGSHNGDGHQYLTENIPNFGEVEYTLDPKFEALLRYNGYWGNWSTNALGIYENSSPSGPAYHDEWIWPSNSVIRPQIPNSAFE